MNLDLNNDTVDLLETIVRNDGPRNGYTLDHLVGAYYYDKVIHGTESLTITVQMTNSYGDTSRFPYCLQWDDNDDLFIEAKPVLNNWTAQLSFDNPTIDDNRD